MHSSRIQKPISSLASRGETNTAEPHSRKSISRFQNLYFEKGFRASYCLTWPGVCSLPIFFILASISFVIGTGRIARYQVPQYRNSNDRATKDIARR
jgi:hypothetical protein